MYDFQRKHGHDIDCHVLAPASTCSNKRASTCITTCAKMVLNGASTCSNTCASTCITTCASTCITTRASTCHYTRARLLFKNMPPGPVDTGNWALPITIDRFPSTFVHPIFGNFAWNDEVKRWGRFEWDWHLGIYIFDILGPLACQKYSICWVIQSFSVQLFFTSILQLDQVHRYNSC